MNAGEVNGDPCMQGPGNEMHKGRIGLAIPVMVRKGCFIRISGSQLRKRLG